MRPPDGARRRNDEAPGAGGDRGPKAKHDRRTECATDRPLLYSRGRHIGDAQPEPRSASDWPTFVEQLDADRAAHKDGAPYVCAPMNGSGRRCAEGAQPCAWLALDLDRIEPDRLADVRLWFARHLGVAWPTHSSRPDAPRERVILALDRDVTRDERIAIGRVIARDLAEEFGEAVLLDDSTLRPEQPLFVPPAGVTLARLDGEALRVDAYLAAASALPRADERAAAETAGGAIERGGRNVALARLAGHLRRAGLDAAGIEAALRAHNETHCAPPLPPAEVASIARSIGRYPTPAAAPSPVERAEAIARARALLMPVREREAPAYPVASLGPLADACATIADHGQVRPAMAGQCLLGAASLLTQGQHNVETLAGWRPLSLYLLSLGDSGDGKSTAQTVALAPVHEAQRAEAQDFDAARREHDEARARRKRGDPPPDPPTCPYRLIRDATVEGLRRDLDAGVCAQGIFTDEAASILAGYGMSAEHRAKTASVFSGLWDRGHLSVSRAIGGRTERYGRRIALHWLVQPAAAADTIGDPTLAALGFWPRFLAAWPEPQEPRLARPFRPETLPAVGAYWRRCSELLAQPLPDDADDCAALALTPGARALLEPAFEAFEREARRGAMRPVKAFALRAAEQACRIAGVLSAFSGAGAVSADTMAGALELVGYSMQTWQALIDEGVGDPAPAHALRLYEWLTGRPDWRERLAVIVKDGPAPTRSKAARDAALAALDAPGLVAVEDGVAVALVPPAGK